LRLSEFSSDEREVMRDGQFEALSLVHIGTGAHLIVLEDDEIPSPWPEGVTAVIASKKCEGAPRNVGFMIARQPYATFAAIHERMAETSHYLPKAPNEIDHSAKIHASAVIAEDSVMMGRRCEIGPFAVVNRGSVLGDNVRIGAGSIIGQELPVPIWNKDSAIRLRPAGLVQIGSNVDIHGNCVVSRGLFDQPTRIDDEVKIDNLVTVGASASVEEGSMLVACANIGNFARIGKKVWIGPNASIEDSVRIGDGAFISIGSTVVEDVGENAKVSGNFAIDHGKFISFIKKIR
jgi:UDP-3-O-[3-hydroxymyristoyl] glucosamine N-acyltransferase